MSEKWLLILGANSDIAKATANLFGQAGWSIYLASKNLDELKKSAANIQIRHGVEARPIYFDARDLNSHSEFYEQLPVKPQGVLLAFGILGNQQKAQIDLPHARLIIETNYLGAVSILEIVSADMEKQKKGFIVGISSVAGDRGRESNYIYGSSKSGLTAYLAGLRQRLFKSGVSVLTVKPGFVKTKMTAELDLPDKLTATPEEVAEKIYQGVERRKNTIYVKFIWRFIMLFIIHLPEFIFKRIKL